MAVDDNWGEAIRKSAVKLLTGSKSEYALKTVKPVLSLVLDESVTDILYIGEASFGSLESGAVWLIKKVDLSSGVKITFASQEFNQVWDDRVSLTYS